MGGVRDLVAARVKACTSRPKITSGDDEKNVLLGHDPEWTSWWKVAPGGEFRRRDDPYARSYIGSAGGITIRESRFGVAIENWLRAVIHMI